MYCVFYVVSKNVEYVLLNVVCFMCVLFSCVVFVLVL